MSNLIIQNARSSHDEGKPPAKNPKIGIQSNHLEYDMYTSLS